MVTQTASRSRETDPYYGRVSPVNFHRDFPYLNDTNLDHRLIGYPAVLNSFVDKISSSRLDMWSSHRNQALVIKGSDFPDIFSGYEKQDGEYTFNGTRRNEDIMVLAVIPRYATIPGVPGGNTPFLTVIYKGLDTEHVGFFDVEKYFLGSDGFGFTYDWKTTGSLTPGNFIPKEQVIASSPNLKGSKYGAGVNLATAFLSTHKCIEDAFWISETAAQAFSSDEFHRVAFRIPQEARPLNIHGDDHNFKIFPDIGEYVQPGKPLCAFRNVSTTTCTADTAPELMREINFLTDDVIVVREGSQVVNLEFIVAKELRNDDYDQVEKYRKASIAYYRAIFDVYHNEVKGRYQLTERFNRLVTDAIKQLAAVGTRLPDYNDAAKMRVEFEGVDREPVEFIQAIVTYRRFRKCDIGFKISGQSGEKGVIGCISKDEDMPRDAFGNIAHVVMDPNSITARTNPSQYWFCGINWISAHVQKLLRVKIQTDKLGAYDMLLDYLNDIRPNYAAVVAKLKTTPAKKIALVEQFARDFIKIAIPAGYNGITMKRVLEIAAKWEVPESPVTFYERDENGIPHEIVTDEIVRIGRKYWYCLEKIPHSHSAGFARVAHQGYPIKAGHDAKLRCPISINPIKTGEDELRFLAADAGVGEVTRLTNYLGNSPRAGTDLLIRTLHTQEHPTQLGRLDVSNRDLMLGNTILGTLHHKTSIIGIDTRRTFMTNYDRQFATEAESDDILNLSDAERSDYGSDLGGIVPLDPESLVDKKD